MTEAEKIEFEKEIRHKILLERRAAKAEWRRNNKESIRKSNQKYYAKKKAEKEGVQANEERNDGYEPAHFSTD